MLRGKKLWEKLLAEQYKWIETCGGDRSGYVAKYQGKYKRTVENAEAIYNADVGELERIKKRLSRCH